nr:hypothetical protein BACY1_33120 [Tenacibaculum mesophilum]
MEGILFPVLAGIIGVAVGFFIAKMLEKSNANKLIQETKKEANSILKEAKVEAEAIKKDKILQAKEKFIELKSEHEKVILSREKKVSDVEKRIRDKESQVSSELDKNRKLNKQLEKKKLILIIN